MKKSGQPKKIESKEIQTKKKRKKKSIEVCEPKVDLSETQLFESYQDDDLLDDILSDYGY